jgi:hypothetical protein
MSPRRKTEHIRITGLASFCNGWLGLDPFSADTETGNIGFPSLL